MSEQAPPPYQKKVETPSAAATSQLNAYERNGIPVNERRSMEDLARPLPQGWIRQLDVNTGHHFYVDLRGSEPKSSWTHPAEGSSTQGPSRESIEVESTDEEGQPGTRAPATSTQKPPPTGLKKFGRNIKDKMTGSTHEERKAKRKAREEAERRAYQQHLALRQAMMKAAQTGQPQLLGHDRSGKEVWVQPPPPEAMMRGYGYSPYDSGFGPGSYRAPMNPYGGRGRGMGYGGGMGMPIGLGLGGGLLLGAALF